jgi:hypothetical protein
LYRKDIIEKEEIMFKKLLKMLPVISGALVMFLAAGCGFIAHFNQDWMADHIANAIAEDDEDALWESLSPASQEEILRSADNDLKEAKKGTLAMMKLFAWSQDIDPDDLSRDEGLRKRLANKLKSNDMLVKISGRWYLGKKR